MTRVTVVTVRCPCGARRDIAQGELPVGAVPKCQCGTVMLPVKGVFQKGEAMDLSELKNLSRELEDTETYPEYAEQKRELARALRAGCLVRPAQCFGYAYRMVVGLPGPTDGFPMQSAGASCAIGAIADGLEIARSRLTVSDDLVNAISKVVRVPVSLVTKLVFMNDVQRRTREEIADWLEL